MTAEEIRATLANDYNFDVEAMAKDHRLPVATVTHLLQKGGAALREEKKPTGQEATYDVAFAPMVNVRIRVEDPLNPTEAEQEEILRLAKQAVADNFDEKLGAENASLIRLWSVGGKEVPRHYVFGNPGYDIDPEIVLELSQLLYPDLYKEEQDGIEVSHLIRDLARELTEKYKNTDWEEGDFWLTMEQEADDFLKKRK